MVLVSLRRCSRTVSWNLTKVNLLGFPWRVNDETIFSMASLHFQSLEYVRSSKETDWCIDGLIMYRYLVQTCRWIRWRGLAICVMEIYIFLPPDVSLPLQPLYGCQYQQQEQDNL